MFGPDLYLLLSEILVGSTALLAICVVAWLVIAPREIAFMPWLGSQFIRLFGRYLRSGEAASQTREYLMYPILAATVLGLGLAIQSIVDDIVDSSPIIYSPVARIGQFTLKTEEAYRFSAIFEELPNDQVTLLPPPLSAASKECDWTRSYELSPLGAELLLPQKEIFAHVLDVENELHRAFFRDTDNFLLTPSKAHCDLATTIALKMYYDATAWALSQETFRDVLLRWETQVDFLGSLSLCAGIILVFSVLAMGAWKGLNVAVSRNSLTTDWRRVPLSPMVDGAYGKFSSAVRIAVMAAVLWQVGGYGFVIAQRNYIERALGTYASDHHFERISTHPLGCLQIERLIERENRDCAVNDDACVAANELFMPKTCDLAFEEPEAEED